MLNKVKEKLLSKPLTLIVAIILISVTSFFSLYSFLDKINIRIALVLLVLTVILIYKE